MGATLTPGKTLKQIASEQTVVSEWIAVGGPMRCITLATNIPKVDFYGEAELWILRQMEVFQDGEWQPIDGPIPAVFIDLVLLRAYEGDWWVKCMQEVEGPYFYDCPLWFLRAAPVTCERWRQRYQKYHMAMVDRRQA